MTDPLIGDLASLQFGSAITQSGPIIAQSPEVLNQSGPIIAQSPQAFNQSGPIIAQSTEVLNQSGPIIAQSLQVFAQSCPITAQSPQVLNHSGPIITQSPQVLKQSEPIRAQSPQVLQQCEPIIAYSLSVLTQSPQVLGQSVPVVPQSPQVLGQSVPVLTHSSSCTSQSGSVSQCCLSQSESVSQLCPSQSELVSQLCPLGTSSSISARDGGSVNAPALSGCSINGPVTFNFSKEQPADGELEASQPAALTQVSREKALRQALKASLALRYARIFEGSSTEGRARRVDDIYTELLIVDEHTGGALQGHEAQWMEQSCFRRSTCSCWVQCNDIFRGLHDSRKVLTLGVAGVGKTVSIHKFILDWAEGRANQDVAFLFPLPFRQLNMKSKRKQSLWELLMQSFPELKELDTLPDCTSAILFIFDGLDESEFQLDFHKELISDPTEPASLDVLVSSLISGHMLPAAYVWVTSRPAAATQISRHFDQVTEVQGFTDEQKDRYFEKNTSAPMARRIIAHMKKRKTLHIMCQLPVFCWILSVVLEEMWKREAFQTTNCMISSETSVVSPSCKTANPRNPCDTPAPSTLTEIYTRFLLYQLGRRSEMTTSTTQRLLRLGKLAFHHLEKRKLIFDAADLRACGIDSNSDEGSEFSITCTQIFKEETADLESRLYSFLHLSMQEYLAALYVLHSDGRAALKPRSRRSLFAKTTFDVQKVAVDRALRSDDGHLDLFLRFLLGLSLDSNQRLLQRLLPELDLQAEPSSRRIIQYIHKTIRECVSAERSINLFHCLSELQDDSLVQEVSLCLSSGQLRPEELTQTQWSALSFLLLTAEETQREFELQRYWACHQGLRRLLPVVRNTQRALMQQCDLTESSCLLLASALTSGPSPLTLLDLSKNLLLDRGVKIISKALETAECPLQTLRLSDVGLSGVGCGHLVSALRSKFTHLRELDLSSNYIRDTGASHIALFLKNLSCKLEKLSLMDCGIQKEGGAALGVAFCSNPAHLRVIDLSSNQLQDMGVKHMMSSLGDQRCRLGSLRLINCGLSDVSCGTLASSLQSNPSHLTELDLSGNPLGDQGANHLKDILTHPQSHLEILRLRDCGIRVGGVSMTVGHAPLRELDLSKNLCVDSALLRLSSALQERLYMLQILRLTLCRFTTAGCESLFRALRLNSSSLQELDLSRNNVMDCGSQLLSIVLKQTQCTLKRLRLKGCGISYQGMASLCFALKENPFHLTELNMNCNDLGDLGMKHLSGFLKDPCCTLQELALRCCSVGEEGCADLAAALLSNPAHLRKLDLSSNSPGDTGVTLLAQALKDPRSKLETLDLLFCCVHEEGWCALVSALSTNPSHLREINLTEGHPGRTGARQMGALLENPLCKLHTIILSYCEIDAEAYSVLASALVSNPSWIRNLSLNHSNPGDAGASRLASLIRDPRCKLETLRMKNCRIKEAGFVALAAALKSNPSHMRELNLSSNNPGESGVKELATYLKEPHCRLEIFRLNDCGIRKDGFECLVSALKSNPLHLQELSLLQNSPGQVWMDELLNDPHYRLQTLKY